MLAFLAYTPVYMAISNSCGLEIGEASGEPFLDAFYLSIETMTTIGYVGKPFLPGICSRTLMGCFVTDRSGGPSKAAQQ